MASASSIYRNNIKRWNGRITPASLHGCRVAIKDDNSYFVASGNEVLILQVYTFALIHIRYIHCC